MTKVLEAARKVAPTDEVIVLQGEPDTGREQLARYIHANSMRAAEPFVKFEAVQAPAGLQTAAGGTAYVVLPEAEAGAQPDLSALAQAAAQAGCRLIAATYMEPEGWEGAALSVPPLRERKEDLEELTYRFLTEITSPGAVPPGLTAEAIAAMLLHDWPGNLRELRRVLFRAMVQNAGASPIGIGDLPRNMAEKLREFGPKKQVFRNYMHSAERLLIRWALAACNQDRTKSAKFLGLSRAALYKKLKLYPDLGGAGA